MPPVTISRITAATARSSMRRGGVSRASCGQSRSISGGRANRSPSGLVQTKFWQFVRTSTGIVEGFGASPRLSLLALSVGNRHANALELFVGPIDSFAKGPAGLAALGPAGLECAHVEAQGARIEVDLDATILIDPADVLGIGGF